MKTHKLFIVSALTAAIGVAAANTAAKAEISKPKGASGSGNVAAFQPKNNQFWWPDQLDLSSLRDHDGRSNPLGENFDYSAAFGQLDLEAVKKDIAAVR